MRTAVLAATALLCAGCVVAPMPPPPAVAVAPYCREFATTVMVNGAPVAATGQACQRPDGTWQVTQYTPGYPQPQVFVVPPPPYDYYVYPYPWWGTVTLGVGGGVFFGGPARYHGAWHGGWRR